MSKIINFDDWLKENEIYFDPFIGEDSYMILTFKNAMEKLDLPYKRKSVIYLQEKLDIIDDISNNKGIVDIITFVSIVTIAFSDDDDTLNPILYYTQTKLNAFYMGLDKKNTFLSKLKNIFNNFKLNK